MQSEDNLSPREAKRAEHASPSQCGHEADLQDSPWKGLYLRTPVEEFVEDLGKYRPGGYHPVHLHTKLNGGRYEVVHKLGYGGFSTVWLCLDAEAKSLTYVAVKILVASESKDDCQEFLLSRKLQEEGIQKSNGGKHICLPLNHFEIIGPNGTHLCLVYPVLGPSAAHLADLLDNGTGTTSITGNKVDTDENVVAHAGTLNVSKLRKVCKQAVRGLSALHKRGICHGDFRPSNILLKLQSLDGLNEKGVVEMLGKPQLVEIVASEGLPPISTITYAPSYLVHSVDYSNVDLSLISTEAYVTDLGQSFDTSKNLNPTSFGIPVDYRAPETVLSQISGALTMDLWSLGCTLFEIRTGEKLFDVFQEEFDEIKYLFELAALIGKPPEIWWAPREKKVLAMLSRSWMGAEATGQIKTRKSASSRRTSIKNRIKESTEHESLDGSQDHNVLDEARDLSDLLEKLVRWEPEERLGAQQSLKHPWFI